MKIENIEVFGFRSALRGMRNPMDSWDRSDSTFYQRTSKQWYWNGDTQIVPEVPDIGPKDLELACKLVRGGSEHRKFLRQIEVWFDITNPIFVWSEFDTYKVATVRNSCSTMHTLGLRDLTQDDFELPISETYLKELNAYGEKFRHAKVIRDHQAMNQIRHEYKNALPSGFLQKATFLMNYETALNMFFQRRGHRLPEWNVKAEGSICQMINRLPYMQEFIEARGG